MVFSESIQKIVASMAERFGNDIDAAVDKAVERVAKLPDFPELTMGLVRQAIREQIHLWRHKLNVQMRREAGDFGGPSKVDVGASEDVGRAALSYYGYFIGGRTLGTIFGHEIPGLMASEAEKAEGHRYNVRLLERLERLVPAEKDVAHAVKAKQLEQIFRQIGIKKPTKDAA